ncbi:DUF3732 domain-containing protein [Vibrio cyclitrophicus]
MKAIISDIVLFSYSGDKRHLSFGPGLNIITGDSKTGKSALIEIVDFCLFSKRSTIPVGKVTDWTEIFSVVYTFGDKKLIIARPINNLGKCYFKVETDFDTKKYLTRSYLESLSLKDLKQAQINFEEHLGLSVTSTREFDDQSRQSGSRATVRDAASLMFQHQNLIANKHSIFYRFDDFYKRSKAISDLPIHLGWADGDYFSLKREHECLLKEIRKGIKLGNNSKLDRAKKINKLKEPIECYYNSLGLVLEDKDLTLANLTKIAKNLPKVPDNSHENSDLGKQIAKLKKERQLVNNELAETNRLIEKVGDNSGDAYEYSRSMRQLLDLSLIDKPVVQSIECPLCSSALEEVSAVVEEVQSSRHELIDELSKVGVFKQDNSEFLAELMKQRVDLKKKIRNYSRQVNDIEKSLGISKNAPLMAKLYTLNGRISANLELILEEQEPKKEKYSSDNLAEKLKEIEEKIAGYDLKNKIEEANVFINKTMNDLKDKLDFEDELKPGEMRFDLATFDFYYLYKSKKVRLSEMGSGANWLACHLSLFLSLLKLSVREDSSIPPVLFLDQPSQVYFPKVRKTFSSLDKEELILDTEVDKVDENIVQVINIFNVIEKFLDELEKDENIKFRPQVIVLEHADEQELAPFIRERWSTSGKKLI